MFDGVFTSENESLKKSEHIAVPLSFQEKRSELNKEKFSVSTYRDNKHKTEACVCIFILSIASA